MWNQIIEFISNWRNWDILIGGIFQTFVFLYIVFIVERCDFKFRKFISKQIVFNSIFLGIFLGFMVLYIDNFPRVIAYYTLFGIQIKSIFNMSTKKSLFYSFLILIFLMLSEIIFATLLFSIFKISSVFVEKYVASGLLMDIFISGLLLLFIKMWYKNFKKLSVLSEKINDKFVTILLFVVVTMMLILMNKGSNWILGSEFIIYYLFALLILYMLFNFVKQIVKNQDIVEKYDTLFEHLTSTENLLGQYQEINHERKNDLINLRGMVEKDKRATQFIDCLLKDNVNNSNKWITKIINIPSGGLKALVYDKVSKMVSSDIKVDINVSKRIEEFDFNKLSVLKYKDLSRIVAILLDNAYEAARESKAKNVSIDFDCKNNTLELIIANTYSNKIELEKVDKKGFSTKGITRGYGLSIFSDIVNKNKNITEKKEINDDYYYQYVYIKKTRKK